MNESVTKDNLASLFIPIELTPKNQLAQPGPSEVVQIMEHAAACVAD